MKMKLFLSVLNKHTHARTQQSCIQEHAEDVSFDVLRKTNMESRF